MSYDFSMLTPPPAPGDIAAIAVRALVLYSLAEHQAGFATTIRIKSDSHFFSVADDGRGHAIHRSISRQNYLPFIYTHLQYPFAKANVGDAGAVQLQGIGMSLLNLLCSELSVVVRKREGTLHLAYAHGQLLREIRDEQLNESTGTSVSGAVHSVLQTCATDIHGTQQWLQRIVDLHPRLHCFFNDSQLESN